MIIDLKRFTEPCSCGRTHAIDVQGITIEPGAAKQLGGILSGYAQPVFLCDANTKKAAQPALGEYFNKHKVIELTGEWVHADNAHVDEAMRALPADADVLVAVGSGSLHDLARYVAMEVDIPFISMPTAASVDGFVSTVSAMTWDGVKVSYPGKSPVYVLADTDIFGKAPARLTAAGVSDLLGKYTALMDWRIAHIVSGEYLCERIYALTQEAVREVEAALARVKAGEQKAMEQLMYALLLSGLAMQMTGNSRPASGAEHHISHLWEMAAINEPVNALHGEMVSVGLLLCLEAYGEIRDAVVNGKCAVANDYAFETGLLERVFTDRTMLGGVLRENGEDILTEEIRQSLPGRLPAVAAALEALPSAREMRGKLLRSGCVTRMDEIGIPADKKELTLAVSPYVRRRLTLMRLRRALRIG